MGYFNYFIKCIIRNFAYKLCKPKVFLTVLLCCLILFGLHTKGYCAEWSDSDIDTVLNDLTSIVNALDTQVAYLSSINTNVGDIETQLNTIKTTLNNIKTDTSNISTNLNTLLTNIYTVNSTLSNIYQQNNIYYESVTNELEEIKKILTGSSAEVGNLGFKQDNSFWLSPNPQGASITSTVYSSNPGDGRFFQACHFRDFTTDIDYVFEKGYTYTITIDEVLSSNSGSGRFYYTYDTISTGNEIYCYYLGNFTQNSFSFTFTPLKDGVITFFTENFGPFWSGMVRYNINKVPNGSLSSIGDNLNNVNNSINQGNQLQQEQNNFLQQGTSDTDVSVDGFNSVNSNDITTSGLTGIFTNIYNSISNWNSKDISLPIPYTTKSIVIPANYTNNMLSSFGGGWIVTFVSSIYYFIVARFMIYSITNIINSIKSGSILETDTKNNITTDML